MHVTSARNNLLAHALRASQCVPASARSPQQTGARRVSLTAAPYRGSPNCRAPSPRVQGRNQLRVVSTVSPWGVSQLPRTLPACAGAKSANLVSWCHGCSIRFYAKQLAVPAP